MSGDQSREWMQGVDCVVRDSLRFKSKLDIGEDVYTSLKLKKYLLDALDGGNGAIAGIGVAKTSAVASTFFAPSGFLGVLGIGTAVTPIGWVVAAGIVGAGLSIVIGKKIVRGQSNRVKVIPDFINTPLDLLGTCLFDMMATLGLKIAKVDSEVTNPERAFIISYFINEWGYDKTFVERGIYEIEKELDSHSIANITEQLARFKKENKDCNYESMSKDLIAFVNGVMEADGIIDEREEMAIEKVEKIFGDVNSFSIIEATMASKDAISAGGKRGVEFISESTKSSLDTVSNLGGKARDYIDSFWNKKAD